MPSCCPLYVLPPNGGQATYLMTYKPEAFNSAGSPSDHPMDHSILLIRNNLTAFEPVLLKAVTRIASVSFVKGLYVKESAFPTATGSPADAVVNFVSAPTIKRSSKDSTGESIYTMASEPFARFDLRSDVFCAESMSSICRLRSLSTDNSMSSLAFEFHEGHLRALCESLLV